MPELISSRAETNEADEDIDPDMPELISSSTDSDMPTWLKVHQTRSKKSRRQRCKKEKPGRMSEEERRDWKGINALNLELTNFPAVGGNGDCGKETLVRAVREKYFRGGESKAGRNRLVPGTINIDPRPRTINIDAQWVNDWVVEGGMTPRRRNRKWTKREKRALKERVQNFWRNINMLERLLATPPYMFPICTEWAPNMLHWEYAPYMRNLDQSPFHMNFLHTYVMHRTIGMNGCPLIPLLENHAVPRVRWSLNTVIDSDEGPNEREDLPGFEVMFRTR